MKKKIKVGVVMGGPSSEHEISVLSGKEIISNLDNQKYEVVEAFIDRDGRGIDSLTQLPVDVFFIALHGTFGEDGGIQRLLDDAGKKYTGSGPESSLLGMDKTRFISLMRDSGITVPGDAIGFPCFVKPADQGSSVGASIAKNESELKRAVKMAKKYSRRVLIEEYIKGVEVTCSILGNSDPTALPVIEIVPKKGDFFNYDSKYVESGALEIVPARISKVLEKKVQETALKVYKLTGCRGFGRVDMIIKDNTDPVVLEINTIPGLTPMSLFPKAAMAVGIAYPDLLDRIISYALE